MMIIEVKNMSTKLATTNNKKYMEEKGAHEEEVVDNIDDDHDVPLPGFRFHPTDEELVGFYLRRKVEKKPISIELIKQADIYKYDPWDLPKSTNVGEKDKEWYFFCKRGRKYKNSVRPNRVTGSGFWKATGIDRPILSGRDCIGLKKSLVYYRGSAGKGTKTEWMMHEFRLPTTKHIVAQEAEVWTLCRILKRSVPYRKCVPDWRLVGVNKKVSSGNIVLIDPPISEACSVESNDHRDGPSSYISFSAPVNKQNNFDNNDKRLYFSSSGNAVANSNIDGNEFSGQQCFKLQAPAGAAPALCSSFPSYNSIIDGDINELLRHADWEDLRSVVDCAAIANSSSMY